MSGEYRPIPPGGRDALPGHRDPSAYFYVGHGADCVLLCEVVAERDRKDHHEDQHQRWPRTTHKGETHQ